MNSPPLSASFCASEWHRTDALQKVVITFRWETFLSVHLYPAPVHLQVQYLSHVIITLRIMTLSLIQAFDPKAFHFLTVSGDRA